MKHDSAEFSRQILIKIDPPFNSPLRGGKKILHLESFTLGGRKSCTQKDSSSRIRMKFFP